MNPTPDKKSKPFSLRLTPQERLQLEKRAGAQSLGEYIRKCLFGAQSHKLKSPRSQFPTTDKQSLAKALALLGRSSLGSSMAKLAEAVHFGALPLSEETERALQEANADIATIKSLIMKALGIRED